MYKVLIVDDEMPALRYMQAIVEKYAPSFEVADCCTSGEAAIAYLQREHIDLMLTDINMPSMDGITLSLKAREIQPDIHIVIITGYADFEYAKRAIRASVNDYILKPVGVSQMKDTLDKLRLQMDYNKKLAQEGQKGIREMMESYPQYKAEVMEIVDGYP